MLEIKFCPAWPLGNDRDVWKGYVTIFDGALILPHILLSNDKDPRGGEIFLQNAAVMTSKKNPLGEAIAAAYREGFEVLSVADHARKLVADRDSVRLDFSFRDTLVKVSPARVSSEEITSLDALDLVLTLTFNVEQGTEVQQSLTSTCRLQPKTRPSFLHDRKAFDGWVALDFGTSSSTATVWRFDRKPNFDAIPVEHRNALLDGILEWLNSSDVTALPGADESIRQEWKSFIADLGTKHVSELLLKQYEDFGAQRLTWEDAIRDIEKSLAARSPLFRRAAGNRLARIYSDALRKPALYDLAIDQIPLDYSNLIKSSLLFKSNYPDFDAIMGVKAKDEYFNMLARSTEVARWNLFHPSPKRYLGDKKSFQISLPASDGSAEKSLSYIESNQVVQVAYDSLLRAVWKQEKGQNSDYRFRRILATFPTIASPSIRREIKKTLHILGADDVCLRYDEAVAAVMFHIWLEYCSSTEPMLESFKIGSEFNQSFVKRVLLIDVGGGTTDLALVELDLHEEKAFEEGEDRGAGGRYYVLTPKVLRSTGRMHLGGDLMTLALYRLLKVSLANYLYLNRARIDHPDLQKNFSFMDTFFQADNSLLNWFVKYYRLLDDQSKIEMNKALLAADMLLHTRSKDEPENLKIKNRLQLFYSIWEKAEELKERLSSKQQILKPEELKRMLEAEYKGIDLSKAGSLCIPYEHFKEALDPILKKIGELVKGMLTSKESQDLHVHWLILSGQSCKLDLLQQEIERLCSEVAPLQTIEQWTFEPEYAKTATSVGAIITESFNQLRPNVKDSKGALRSGRNLIHIDTSFLFHYLPSGFGIQGVSSPDSEILLKPNTTMWQLDEEPVLKARSDWVRMRGTNLMRRIDFNKEWLPWGKYEWNVLQGRLKEAGQRLEPADFWLMFEVTDELIFRVYVRKGDPFYILDQSSPDISYSIQLPIAKPDSIDSPNDHAIRGDQLHWDIIIKDEYENTLHTFKMGDRLDQQFLIGLERLKGRHALLEPPTALSGLLKKSEEYSLFIKKAPDAPEEKLDRIAWELNQATRNCARVVTLLQNGTLQLHRTLPKFKVTEDALDLLKEGEGHVLRDILDESEKSKLEDPFDGTH